MTGIGKRPSDAGPLWFCIPPGSLTPHSRCPTSGFFVSVLCLSEALFLASRFVKSDACIASMNLHEKPCTAFPRSGYTGRGSDRIMHRMKSDA